MVIADYCFSVLFFSRLKPCHTLLISDLWKFAEVITFDLGNVADQFMAWNMCYFEIKYFYSIEMEYEKYKYKFFFITLFIKLKSRNTFSSKEISLVLFKNLEYTQFLLSNKKSLCCCNRSLNWLFAGSNLYTM